MFTFTVLAWLRLQSVLFAETMATGSDLYDISCSVPCVNDGSADDEEEDDEVMYEDLLVSGDLVTSQLASSGKIALILIMY